MLISTVSLGQNYTSYFLGNTTNILTVPKGGVCMMGGATEHDEAMKWFLQQANGGDVLVLRTSGSDGYNDYLLNQLGVTINSVETIVCHNAAASQDLYIQQKIEQAEAIWFAGGDQWNYISYWRNTPVDSLINLGIANRKVVVGGTSAGMAILGAYYFSAENGTVTSGTALSNPYNSTVTVSNLPFLENEYLENVITDTHYDNPDRKGRHVVFISRILQDSSVVGKGIACDEYTAVCMDTNGFCKIYGDYPNYDENVYFIQPNCELTDMTPENCSAGNPLTWNRGGEALKVYHAKGTNNGSQTFDLSDWISGTGGVWENWYVENGALTQTLGTAPNCGTAQVDNKNNSFGNIYPNPVISGEIYIENVENGNCQLFDSQGKAYKTVVSHNKIDVSGLTNGIYYLQIENTQGIKIMKLDIRNY